MPVPETRYLFSRSERGIFAEIYFPKRAAYYGAIFNALRHGYDEHEVKTYLRRHVVALLNEFQTFPDLFNPHRYTAARPRRTPPSTAEALERIDMYQSPFKGWSVYSVDGVFFDAQGEPTEEATQVVRVMFRFDSSFTEQAAAAGCPDVLRSILFWVISQQGRLDEHKVWSKAEQAQFIARHRPWPKRKRLFAQQHFQAIASEAAKWVDDRALFVFAYLVRKFWGQVVEERLYEEEIWVINLFDLVVNVVKRTEQ
ncbi:MAG: hypothetical protein G01um101438_576 [Parcubacteria group bacterium Gr01-1014_38]|nr:MAG: hypothetical protein G01um101438_576 [Parcubacteria group bacterium Gr01-1014_38]